ncbi:hypothetical protein LTS18_005325 [Coniosporium uncinatum]|uniref:Uncharacterized protein n=1 Tax=Coniosporium uncinatum TaxID=93489 RepID=A0ACC3D4R7_9PEZI|nr:hypothetical protein LTS18_005325 [Coniosporium uncinatum]
MPSEIQPGRPGNLTADQEVKLRELWSLVVKLFGIGPSRASIEVSSAAADTQHGTPSADAKKKKRGISLFKKKDKDSAASDAESATSGASTPVPDLASLNLNEADKHGMNQAFKDALAAHSSEEMRTAFWSFVKHDHPDGLLLRFLRARKWDVQAALVMMVATMHWRITEAHVDNDVMLRGEMALLKESQSSDKAQKKEGDDFMAQLRMGKSFLHGYDKQGRPICFVRVRLHRAGEQTEASLERFTVYTIETARLFLRPPVDTAVRSCNLCLDEGTLTVL